MRKIAAILLLMVGLAGLFAPALAPHDYGEQFRTEPDSPSSPQFPMGTDRLGRDRLSRLLYATRISLVLAPAAALISTLVALLLALLAGTRADFALSGFTTLFLSLPWIFLFLILRALLPLNTSPVESILLTFGLMGAAGWAWPARTFIASIRGIRQSSWLMQARAAGVPGWRIAAVYFWPHLGALALAQFRVLIPAYILAEASLGLLGLGVAEPLPSWGNLLTELQRPETISANPWVLAPLGLLMLVMVCLEMLGKDPGGEALG